MIPFTSPYRLDVPSHHKVACGQSFASKVTLLVAQLLTPVPAEPGIHFPLLVWVAQEDVMLP